MMEEQLPTHFCQNEQYIQALFNSSSVMVALLDLQGHWIGVNQTTLDRFGHTKTEFLQMSVSDITHPHDHHITPKYTAEILAGARQNWRGEKRFVMKTGEICYMDLTINPLRHQGGEIYGFIGIGVDITEKKNAAIALAESERNLSRLMRNLPGMIFRYQDQPGWPIEFVSEGSRTLTGYSPEDFYGQGSIAFPQLIHARDWARVQEIKRRKAYQDDSYEVEYRILTKKGELRWVWERSRVIAKTADGTAVIEGFITDITARKQDEKKLKRLQSAIENASETIVITDPNGVIQYVNPAFEELTGYSREEVIGNRPDILKSGKHDQQFYDAMWDTLMRGEIWKGHLINKNKHGELFEEEATITPIMEATGTICHFVGIKRNVTREVALKKQLQQAQRMEAIGTLAGGIAHDFNNILTSILGYAEIAHDQTPAASGARTSMERVIQAGDRAARLVKQILTFSRENDEELLPVRLHQTVQEVLSLLRSSLPATITLQQHIDPDCPPVRAEATQIHQVIMNLCVNARQAIGNNQGRIDVIMTGKKMSEPFVAVNGMLLKPDTYVMIEVRDNGCGMSDEIQTKIFDPFFTTKTISEGTGLGLSVVHGIVKRHGGAITLASAPGKGTSFRLCLPVCEEPVDIHAQKFTQKMRGEETILLVDDEQLLVEMLHNGLAQLGYSVISFTNCTDALAYFTSHQDMIDLVVTDMTMPVMAGDVFSKQLLRLKPDLPIILCTGFSEAMDETRARSLGIRKFIMKPVGPHNLAQAIRTILQDGRHPHS